MRTGWLIEDAASSPAAPAYAAVADVGHDQFLVWTRDPGQAVALECEDYARRFADLYSDRPVRLAEREVA